MARICHDNPNGRQYPKHMGQASHKHIVEQIAHSKPDDRKPDTCGHDDAMIMNVGTGHEITIADLAALVAEVVGYRGDVRWDRTKPDGMPQKVLDTSRIAALGWVPRISLRQGLNETYLWYQTRLGNGGR